MKDNSISRADVTWFVSIIGSIIGGVFLTLTSFFQLKNQVEILNVKMTMVMKALNIEPSKNLTDNYTLTLK